MLISSVTTQLKSAHARSTMNVQATLYEMLIIVTSRLPRCLKPSHLSPRLSVYPQSCACATLWDCLTPSPSAIISDLNIDSSLLTSNSKVMFPGENSSRAVREISAMSRKSVVPILNVWFIIKSLLHWMTWHPCSHIQARSLCIDGGYKYIVIGLRLLDCWRCYILELDFIKFYYLFYWLLSSSNSPCQGFWKDIQVYLAGQVSECLHDMDLTGNVCHAFEWN